MRKDFILVFIIMGMVSSGFKSDDMNMFHQNQEIMQKENKAEHYTKVADQYLKFLTEKNLEGILSLFAEEATVEDPVGSEVQKGKKVLREFYTGAVTMDLQLTRTGPVRVAGDEVAFPFQLRMEVDGQKTVTDIIDVFRFDEEGKIISMRAYWGPSNRRPAEE